MAVSLSRSTNHSIISQTQCHATILRHQLSNFTHQHCLCFYNLYQSSVPLRHLFANLPPSKYLYHSTTSNGHATTSLWCHLTDLQILCATRYLSGPRYHRSVTSYHSCTTQLPLCVISPLSCFSTVPPYRFCDTPPLQHLSMSPPVFSRDIVCVCETNPVSIKPHFYSQIKNTSCARFFFMDEQIAKKKREKKKVGKETG